MKIISSAFEHNQNIPKKYTCDGENVSPAFSFVDVPKNAKSLVLIVDDPDATISTFVHWIVFNINPAVNEIAENSIPQGGVEGMTDFGKPGYGGACPPSGTHRYFFKLYALDTTLNLSSNAGKKEIEQAMQNHVLASTELIGLYSRSK
ncbi:MAG: YbhB/YbcL family Raf kinase inhibitor-like protein [Candidatus Levybacteria bacterium]|nr:YbhB/YbcL family Raf kinase inhibitor-like protein [Candidatus Levybacteria bacterium]